MIRFSYSVHKRQFLKMQIQSPSLPHPMCGGIVEDGHLGQLKRNALDLTNNDNQLLKYLFILPDHSKFLSGML